VQPTAARAKLPTSANFVFSMISTVLRTSIQKRSKRRAGDSSAAWLE
jgi:hypothetical protein